MVVPVGLWRWSQGSFFKYWHRNGVAFEWWRFHSRNVAYYTFCRSWLFKRWVWGFCCLPDLRYYSGQPEFYGCYATSRKWQHCAGLIGIGFYPEAGICKGNFSPSALCAMRAGVRSSQFLCSLSWKFNGLFGQCNQSGLFRKCISAPFYRKSELLCTSGYSFFNKYFSLLMVYRWFACNGRYWFCYDRF